MFLFLLKFSTCSELLCTWEFSADAGPGTSLYLCPEISFPFPPCFTISLCVSGIVLLSQLPMTNLNCPNFQLPPGSLPQWSQRNFLRHISSFLSHTLSPHSISNNLCKWIHQYQNNIEGRKRVWLIMQNMLWKNSFFFKPLYPAMHLLKTALISTVHISQWYLNNPKIIIFRWTAFSRQ